MLDWMEARSHILHRLHLRKGEKKRDELLIRRRIFWIRLCVLRESQCMCVENPVAVERLIVRKCQLSDNLFTVWLVIEYVCARGEWNQSTFTHFHISYRNITYYYSCTNRASTRYNFLFKHIILRLQCIFVYIRQHNVQQQRRWRRQKSRLQKIVCMCAAVSEGVLFSNIQHWQNLIFISYFHISYQFIFSPFLIRRVVNEC